MKDKTFTLFQKKFLMGCFAFMMVMPLSAQDLVTDYLNKAIVRAEKASLVSSAAADEKVDLSAAIADAITLKNDITTDQTTIDAAVVVLNVATDAFLAHGVAGTYDTIPSSTQTWSASSDFSGTYLIKNGTVHEGMYFSDIVGGPTDVVPGDVCLVGSLDMYAWEITKNAKGFYNLRCGGTSAVYKDGWHTNIDENFGGTGGDLGDWSIVALDNSHVTIGKTEDLTRFLKSEINPKAPVVGGTWKYYPDAIAADAEPFTLLPAASTKSKADLTNAIDNAKAILTAGASKAAAAKTALNTVITDATTAKDAAASTNFIYVDKINALAAAVAVFDGVVTGVKESLASVVTVSPNPTSDVIKVSNASGLASVVIYSAVGQKVYDKVVTANEVVVSVSDWKSGVYVVALIDKNGARKNVKVIKK